MSNALDEFRDQIEGLRQIAASQRYYIDPKALKSLCTHKLVLNVVKECGVPRHSQEERAKTITAIGFLTFSILVYIRKEELIVRFLESDMFNHLDHRLPMHMDELESIAPGQLKKFEEHQWEFRPVILERHTYKTIGDKFILPFKEDVHREDSDGSFGRIYNVTYEAAMQKLLPAPQNSGTVKVIRKQLLFSGDKKSFDKEREVLKLLEQIRHPNIAEFLCSYTYKQEHSLLFELEEMDLSKFLKLNHRYKDFESNTTFFTAFYGLASALETVHNCILEDGEDTFTVVGYHHDIRPQNILVRANDFVLTDFGLAKMSDEDTSSGTPYKAGFGEYAAPECIDESFVHQRVGRAIDIWSLGAMIVDIASFIEGGAEGKEESVRRRIEKGPPPLRSNTRFHANGHLKTGVKRHIQSLERDAKDKTLRTFLELSRNMLVSHNTRPDASTVRRNASYIAIKSLFRAALEGMVEFHQQFSPLKPNNNWLDLWKLNAWGEIINLNGVQLITPKFADAMRDGPNSERTLQKTLLKLIKKLGTKPFHENDTSSPQRSDIQRADEISKLVSELKRELPTTYQHKLDDRKLEMIQQNKATEVPKLPDEALQLSPGLEPFLVPTVGPTQNVLDDTASHKLSSMIKYGQLAERNATTPGANGNISRKAPSSSAFTSGVNTSAETPASVFDSPNNYHSDDTTPDLADGRISTEQARSDLRLSQPHHKPSITLPGPLIQRRDSDEAHGAILAGTGITAELSFAQQNARTTIPSEVHVRGNQSGDSSNNFIICNGIDRNVSICHDLTQSVTQSAFQYPHTDHPIGDGGSSHTVYFLGKQILEKELRPSTSRSCTGVGQQPQPPKKIETQDVEYCFHSATDCDLFRERVWGKTLVISKGVKKIQGSKSSLGPVKADAVSLSVWKSSGILSVVFRAKEKGEKKHVELELAHSRPVRPQTEGDTTLLILRIESPAPAKPTSKPKNTELRVDFDSEEDCADFKSKILEHSRLPPVN